MQLDLLIVESFGHPNVRARWRSLLASPRGRKKFRDRLAHDFEGVMDPRTAVPLPASVHSTEAIQQIAISLGAPDRCSLISESSLLDGRDMELREALDSVVGFQKGTIISMIPGVLAYFEPEDGRDGRWFLVADGKRRAALVKILENPL